MDFSFTKMNGAGNDFVVVDNRDGGISLSTAQIEHVCDRHRGVGADGFLAVEPPSGNADVKMRYYNSDGGEAEMCGNGARCFARYCQRLGCSSEKLRFETLAGVLAAAFDGDLVEVELSDPHSWHPMQNLVDGDQELLVCSVNTGVPHAVLMVEDVDAVDVATLGRRLRYHEAFAPKGTNVNFIEEIGSGDLKIRTYERGVEEETQACGTGVTAAALVHARRAGAVSPISVQVRGGERLLVNFQGSGDDFHHVLLKGPADFVFEGRISL